MAINSKISKISERILFLKTYGARAIYSNLRRGGEGGGNLFKVEVRGRGTINLKLSDGAERALTVLVKFVPNY